jgi:DNA-binding beta-propeller fold protein YncE
MKKLRPIRMLLSLIVVFLASVLFELPALAQSGAGFGPETFARSSTSNKDNFSRVFTVADSSIPYTLSLQNGNDDGTSRVRKGWITFNGETLLAPPLIGNQRGHLILAVHPQQQNQLDIKLKGGAAGSFLVISIQPTPSTVLNNPSDPAFDSREEGLGTPYGVAVDQASHIAYVADRFYDTVFAFDIAGVRIVNSFRGIDGDQTNGDGGTTGISFVPGMGIVAVNEGEQGAGGSISMIDPANGSVHMIRLASSGAFLHPSYSAVNPANHTAAFSALYDSGRHIYMVDLSTGTLSVQEETMDPTPPAFNAGTNQFVFGAADTRMSPALLVYGAAQPFQFVRRIDSTAPAGTEFEKLAINPQTNIAVAVNQFDAAVYVFDLAAGAQVARIPIDVGVVTFPSADVAINPDANLAVVTSNYIDRIAVIDLSTNLLASEIPLPPGSRPLGVDIDRQWNRAVVAENGLASSMRNGTVLVVQLPTQ